MIETIQTIVGVVVVPAAVFALFVAIHEAVGLYKDMKRQEEE